MATVRPDVLFLDLLMPGMSGLEALAHFRQHYSAVPVIVITASVHEKIAGQARAGGAFAVVGKPVDIATLEPRRSGHGFGVEPVSREPKGPPSGPSSSQHARVGIPLVQLQRFRTTAITTSPRPTKTMIPNDRSHHAMAGTNSRSAA